MSQPSRDQLARALADAAKAHHDYERVSLFGKRDEQWPGFYAAYALGRLGDFVEASALSRWLETAPASDDWPASTAAHVVEALAR